MWMRVQDGRFAGRRCGRARSYGVGRGSAVLALSMVVRCEMLAVFPAVSRTGVSEPWGLATEISSSGKIYCKPPLHPFKPNLSFMHSLSLARSHLLTSIPALWVLSHTYPSLFSP